MNEQSIGHGTPHIDVKPLSDNDLDGISAGWNVPSAGENENYRGAYKRSLPWGE
jgi:hypothetical protein